MPLINSENPWMAGAGVLNQGTEAIARTLLQIPQIKQSLQTGALQNQLLQSQVQQIPEQQRMKQQQFQQQQQLFPLQLAKESAAIEQAKAIAQWHAAQAAGIPANNLALQNERDAHTRFDNARTRVQDILKLNPQQQAYDANTGGLLANNPNRSASASQSSGLATQVFKSYMLEHGGESNAIEGATAAAKQIDDLMKSVTAAQIPLAPGQMPQRTTRTNVPAVGETRSGYKFKGGDPAQQQNWEKVSQ